MISQTEKDYWKTQSQGHVTCFVAKECHSDKFLNELKIWSQRTQYIAISKKAKLLFAGIWADFIYWKQNRKKNRGDSGLKNVFIGRTNAYKSFFQMKRNITLMGQVIRTSFWHCFRRQLLTLFSRQKRGDSLMTWGAFSFNGITDIVFLGGKETSKGYIEVLGVHLLPMSETLRGGNYLYQYQHDSFTHMRTLELHWFTHKNSKKKFCE